MRARSFDLVVNFDEDIRACRLAASVSARRRVGAWTDDGRIAYCAGSAPWFDMSLVSRLGREAADRLKTLGRLADYFDDINRASFVVAGDTLAMHVGLALRKEVVALFTCTSPDEIHGYGRLTKLVDARLRTNFHRRDRPLGEETSISPGKVLGAIARRRKQVLS